MLAGGIGGCRRIAGLAELCGRAFSPHTWSNGLGLVANLHLACAVSTCPFVEIPYDPPGWTPARRDWLLGGPAVEIAADGTVAPPPGPGLGVTPDLDALEAHRVRAADRPARRGPAVRIRAAVLRAYRAPLEVCELELDPPAPARCSCAWPPPASAIPTCTWPTATWARGAIRSCWAMRARASWRRWGTGSRTSRRAIPSRSASCPPCGACAACRAGRLTLCETASAGAWAGTLLDGTGAPARPDGGDVQHFNFVSCFAERCVVPAGAAVPLPRGLPLWQASLLGCGVVTAVGAVRHAARVAPGDSVCVVGCGGVGLQVVAAARLAGAGRIVAVERDAAKLALARNRGATHAVAAGACTDPADAVLAVVPGGVDHAFEAVGSPATIRLAWDVLRPGATAVVVGISPPGAEVSLPVRDLLSEKGLRGSYYGSGNAPELLATMAGMVSYTRTEPSGPPSSVRYPALRGESRARSRA